MVGVSTKPLGVALLNCGCGLLLSMRTLKTHFNAGTNKYKFCDQQTNCKIKYVQNKIETKKFV